MYLLLFEVFMGYQNLMQSMMYARDLAKVPKTGASILKEDIMKLITRFELATKSKDELEGLFRQVFNELANCKPNTLEQANALASLQNIEREISYRIFH